MVANPSEATPDFVARARALAPILKGRAEEAEARGGGAAAGAEAAGAEGGPGSGGAAPGSGVCASTPHWAVLFCESEELTVLAAALRCSMAAQAHAHQRIHAVHDPLTLANSVHDPLTRALH